MSLTLYGIPNCDQVKKARAWLVLHGHTVAFHDSKKAGVTRELIEGWLQRLPWDSLVNRKGTTWRALSPECKASVVDADSAMALMQASPSVIKRPILHTPFDTVAGFSDALYQQIFKN